MPLQKIQLREKMFTQTLKIQKLLAKSVSIASSAALGFGVIVSSAPAVSSSTVDVGQQRLEFNKAKFSTNLGTLITQTQGDDSIALNIGEDALLNSYVLYYDVIGTTDALLTITGMQDLDGAVQGTNAVEDIDEANDENAGDGDNRWINTDIRSRHNTGDSWAEYTLEFFADVDASPRVPVTLTNFVMNTYDIDGSAGSALRQYLEISDFSRYYLTSDTELTVSTVGNRTRFVSRQESSSLADAENRVKVEFDRASRVVFRLGQLTTQSGTPGASYYLDFSSGPSWSPAAAVVSPVIAAAQTPRSVPYEGPLNLRNQSGTLCSGGEGVLTGERLSTITEIYVGDKKVAQELTADGRLKYSLKDIAPGTYQIRYWVPVNSLNLTDQIRVGTCSTAPVATAPGAFEAKKLFANYRGDRGPVIARDRAAIAAFINQYKGITSVKCVGSTSGVPAKSTDPALATARAKNACDIVKTLVPNATFTLETSTGKGVGQRFRSVTIFISGTN